MERKRVRLDYEFKKRSSSEDESEVPSPRRRSQLRDMPILDFTELEEISTGVGPAVARAGNPQIVRTYRRPSEMPLHKDFEVDTFWRNIANRRPLPASYSLVNSFNTLGIDWDLVNQDPKDYKCNHCHQAMSANNFLVLNCFHYFHRECYSTWRDRQSGSAPMSYCPACEKQDIMKYLID